MGKDKKKGKLPKHVLGVKVPKELRKAGEKLIEQAQGPAGRQVIASAVTAAVGAAATAALARGMKEANRDSDAAQNTASGKEEARDRGDVIRNVVNAFMDGMGSARRS